MASFLRQIAFMSEWMHRELLQFSKAMQTKNYMVPGSQVFEEGKELTHVAIVKEGEFLVSKRALDQVYMNPNTGQIKIKTSEGKPVYSSQLKDNSVDPMKVENHSGYTGSKVHMRVKSYLDSLVKEDLTVAQMLTTKHKQVQAKEIQFAVLGKGQIIGEVDAATGRNYIYSLRSKTFNAKLYLIERKEFMALVTQYDRGKF